MREIDNKALRAKSDKSYLEIFIREYELFILQAAQRVTGRYTTKSDDQWSVSLSAFNESIEAYSYDKGAFLTFSEMVIKRRLYDHIKKQSRHFNEVSINPFVFEGEFEEGDDMSLRQEVMNKVVSNDSTDAKLEIEAITGILEKYGFSFFDLVKVSPKSQKTKTSCAKAIAFISKNSLLLFEMRKTGTLPLKAIEKNLGLPRKILERHRKYIIAGVEIISGNYPVLAEYLRFVKDELSEY
jgi:RNA polymerase sigma factor